MSEPSAADLLQQIRERDVRIKAQEEELQRVQQENELLREKLHRLAQRLFGKKSEQLSESQLQLLFQEMHSPGPAEGKGSGPETAETAAPRPSAAPSRERRERKPRLPEHLPVLEKVIVPEVVKACPQQWRQIGEEVTERLDYEPARFLRVRTVRPKYVRRADEDARPLIAPLPPCILERSLATPGLLAQILVAKYCDHLPLYRQECIYRTRHGVELSRQTMAEWVGVAADWLRLIYEHIGKSVFATGYVQSDETPVRYLEPGHGKTRTGYFWTCSAGRDGVIFHWQTSRAATCLEEVIPVDFRGIVQCDGYAAYRTFAQRRGEAIKLAGCMAHVRRKFYEAREQAPRMAAWLLGQFQQLYAAEASLRESRAGPKLREAMRASASRPIMERLHRVLLRLKARRRYLPRSLMGVAIDYTLSQWPLLLVFLTNGRIEIDSNLVENAIRPTALGKKNWLFIGEADAGERSAIIYTIIENCRRRGIDPYSYLRDVFTRLPATTNWQVKELTPEAWQKARQAEALQSAA
jgi:transposase